MKKGFTLIELLIVVIIVGILATAALPRYNKVIERARSAEALVLLAGVRTGQLLYYQDKGGTTFTDDFDDMIVELPDNTVGGDPDSKYWEFTLSNAGVNGYTAIAQRKTIAGAAGQITIDYNGTWGGDHPGKPSL
ncbi:MAG: prepilin-type N-terminal cleavage/methylation domain-containing protein [Candidatus Omnitrophica bacterium]|nr:prepilin-type N-terminal cleavage/methylation domain-containing protein [Candidatus Omnitrophota bacterium]